MSDPYYSEAFETLIVNTVREFESSLRYAMQSEYIEGRLTGVKDFADGLTKPKESEAA